MPERKARKSLFSSDYARRKAARDELETEDERYGKLRTTGKGWLFQEVRIPKKVAAYYEGMDDG